MAQIHKMTDLKYSDDPESDVESDIADNEEDEEEENKLSGTESNENSEESEEEEVEGEDKEEEEEGFWPLMIRETVNTLKQDGRSVEDVDQILEGKTLKNFINHMKTRLKEIQQISNAAETDSVMNMIEQKTEKIFEKMDDGSDEMHENAEELAWKKYKILVKKKLKENVEELEPLVRAEDNDSNDETMPENE